MGPLSLVILSQDDGENWKIMSFVICSLYKTLLVCWNHGGCSEKTSDALGLMVNLSLSSQPSHVREVEVWGWSLLTSALDGDDWWTSRPGRFVPRKELRYALSERLGESQIQSGNFGEKKNIFPLPACSRNGLESRLHFSDKTATMRLCGRHNRRWEWY